MGPPTEERAIIREKFSKSAHLCVGPTVCFRAQGRLCECWPMDSPDWSLVVSRRVQNKAREDAGFA